jgi:hypothetical protein
MPDLEYFDIANELARFIFNKPKEHIVDAISNKLSSSLESLRRRGIPVDRLLNLSNQACELCSKNKQTTRKIRFI